MVMEKKIERENAIQLCNEIRERNKKKKISFSKMMCWGCRKYANGDYDKMCFANHELNRGCMQVNKEYDNKIRSPQVEIKV